jgi:hypothetical protein
MDSKRELSCQFSSPNYRVNDGLSFTEEVACGGSRSSRGAASVEWPHQAGDGKPGVAVARTIRAGTASKLREFTGRGSKVFEIVLKRLALTPCLYRLKSSLANLLREIRISKNPGCNFVYLSWQR